MPAARRSVSPSPAARSADAPAPGDRAPALALFDFDGTLTTRETMPDFIRTSVPRARLRAGSVLLAPLVIGYRLGMVPGTWVRAAIVRVGYRGVSAAAVATEGERFARDVLPPLERPDAMQRLRWHQERGDRVVVVSGGLDVYLRHWCARHEVELLCSSLEEVAGVLTGRYAGAQCVRAEKARRVREACDPSRYARIYAYGDTPEDADLLALAHERHYRGTRVAD